MKSITFILVIFLTGIQFIINAQSGSFHERSSVLLIFHQQYEGCENCDHLTKIEKNTRVYNDLLDLKSTTQHPVKMFLDSVDIDFRSYFVANFIQIMEKVEGSVLDEIEQRFSHLVSIERNAGIEIPESESATTETGVRTFGGEAEWNLVQTGATEVWKLGYRGAGVVIGGQDTGYDWSHPDLYNSYRGVIESAGEVEHDYHWFDAIHSIDPLHGDSILSPDSNPCGLNLTFPCDDHRHGTHTMGIMTGSDEGGTAIGVAPEAAWIGCRNMERGYGSIASYLRCFEWFLAPTRTDGSSPMPETAPHIINNSWSCPEIEGCNSRNYRLIGQAVFNLREAGIFVVVSAGNDGNHCGSLKNPPAIFKSSFAVGSTDESRSISSFSSFGPVELDGITYLKPDVAAPGRDIRSAGLNGGYRTSSGTSMAGSHVAGLAALIISAKPELAGNVERIEEIIISSTDLKFYDGQCGEYSGMASPNFAYGHGIINMLDAVNKALGIVNTENIEELVLPLELYPNPSNGLFQIKCAVCNENTSFVVMDLVGKPLVSGSMKEKTINLEQLNAGYYFLQIITNSHSINTYPIVIKK